MRDETKRRVREAKGSGVYFGDQDLVEALNAGYMELSDESEWNERFLDVLLETDRRYYDLQQIIGPGFLSVKPAFDTSRNRWLVPATPRALDLNDRRWERVVGTPQRILLRGLRWLGLYPRTDAETDRIRVYVTQLPKRLLWDDDEPGFPRAYHYGCVEFALADLYAQDGETSLAQAAWQAYLSIEADLARWVNERTQRPGVHVFGVATVPR